MDLQKFLVWLTTAGAGVLSYWIVNQITAKGKPSTWSAWTVRVVAYAISGSIAILAYLALVAMQYQAQPVDARSWIEALFVVAATSFGLSTMIHGADRLSRNERQRQP